VPLYVERKLPMQCIAHRGFSGRYPENTLLAFRKALEVGADMIEFDVRVSRDGELVVMHDPTVDRTTNGSGRVETLTLRELKMLDAGMGEIIPTFSEVIEELGGKIGMNIHMYAYGEALDRAVEVCVEAGILDEVFFALSDPTEIRRLLRLHSDVYVCSGYRAVERDYLEASVELGARIIQPLIGAAYLTADWVERAHEKGMAVEVFWADTADEMLRLRSLNVDGILTNFPDIFMETFRGEGPKG
jgi:glycerophosphoryl diester phosphodiesterase